ncbi:MAG TPA: ferritin-like domain-containing protein [Mycobacteriales bacterium]|nr:ferritin-like domain-containing protein [Mycobacteriales bacterium]
MSELVALKQALATEQAVVYGYGVAGAHLRGADRKLAASRLVTHQNLRDQLAAQITALGAVAPAALPAYQLPFPVTDAATARQLAAHLEDGAAGAAWDLAAATAARSTSRDIAVGWLSDAAVAASRWGAALPALPGGAS